MDISLNYYETGFGEPLILLHGNGEDMTYFRNQVDCFAEHFRVIAIDSRGHGRSPRGKAPFTIRQFAEDLHDFMDLHHIDRAHILGFSDGGNVAICFALKYPDRVNKLILNGANLYPAGVKAAFQIPTTLEYYFLKIFGTKNEEQREKIELLSLMVNDPYIKPRELHRLTMPTLVIAGERDLIREDHTKLIARHLPNSRLAILPGNHGVAALNPNAFNAEVLNFLLN